METTQTKTVLINRWDESVYPWAEEDDLRRKHHKFVWLKLYRTITNDEPPVYSWEGTLYPSGNSGHRIFITSETAHTYGGDFSRIREVFDILGWVYPNEK